MPKNKNFRANLNAPFYFDDEDQTFCQCGVVKDLYNKLKEIQKVYKQYLNATGTVDKSMAELRLHNAICFREPKKPMLIKPKEKKKPLNINIISTNKELYKTCGSCKHTDNDLGIVALHCQLIYDKARNKQELEDDDWGKVRSWEECYFKPSRWTPRKVK